VFWVHASTRARFEQGYRRIAEVTKMRGWNDRTVDILQLVRSWLSNKRNGRWLMVVDNADDLSLFFRDASKSYAASGSSASTPDLPVLSEFLPQSRNGSILFTSRDGDLAYRLAHADTSIIKIKPMDECDALALVQKKLGSVAGEEKEATELIRALDFMPLAITHAAAFIRLRDPRMSLSRYVEQVRRSDCDHARLLEKDVGDDRRDGRVANPIITTWWISFDHIRKQVPTAARLLSLMSLFDPHGIHESLLDDQYEGNEDTDADFDDDIHTLTSFSLVIIGTDGREFKMHPLVQFSTKKWLELSNELEVWNKMYLTRMDERFPLQPHKDWPTSHTWFPHTEAVLNSRPQDTKTLITWASVLHKAALYLSWRGQYSRAYEMISSALQVRETVLGREHLDTFNSVCYFIIIRDKITK
jgi:hypothetical protein